MAIYQPLSSYTRSKDFPLAANAVLAADGQAMIGSTVNGLFGALPSTGAGTDVFVGFLNTQTSAAPFLQSTATKVEDIVLGPSGTTTLALAPVSGTVSAWDLTAGAAVSGGNLSVDSVGNVTVTGGGSHEILFTYSYALTVTQARAMFGDVQPGGYSGTVVNQASIVQQGTIYTDQFDTTKQWRSATSVKLAANGKVTDQSGSGVTVPCVIIQLPTTDYPFLGLDFNAN